MILLLLACVFITPDERHARECAWSDRDGDGVCDVDDCAPDDATRSPAVPERCNGEDDDCDGVVDDGLYADDDGDGWGVSAEGACFTSWITRDGDCDDTDDRVFPGADDICDGKQDDCDVPWTLAGEAGLVTHVDEAGVVTDMSPSGAGVEEIPLPSSGTVYVCASDEAPLFATLHVARVDGGLTIQGIATDTDTADVAADLATVDADEQRTVVRIDENAGGPVTILDLRITGGGREEDFGDGGGIRAGAGTELSLARSEVVGNVGVFGGVLAEGDLEVVDCDISFNATHDVPSVEETRFYAGGLHAGGVATYVGYSTIAGNYSQAHAGGVHNANGTLVLDHAVIRANTADGVGAGLLVEHTTRLLDSTVAGNTTLGGAHAAGGAHLTDGTLYCYGSHVLDNIGGDGAGVTVRDEAMLYGDDCEVAGNTHDDLTPAQIWASGELWEMPADTCFGCGSSGCREETCPG